MKFQFIAEVDEPVTAYGVAMVSTGDVVELDGWLAEKAKSNPNYRLCDEPIKTEEATPDDEGQPEDSPEFTLEQLRVQWQDKFGEKPHHRKSAETLLEELTNGD